MSEPKITFDVDVKREIRGESEFYKYIDMLDEHQSVKLEFAEIKDALRVQKGMYMLLDRQKRHDIVPMRRKKYNLLIQGGREELNICCLECRHYLDGCCNNPESENYGLETDIFDSCSDGEREEDG